MNYVVNLNMFNGPLDLLLHLIKQSEIDICDIQIVDITEQYLAFIKQAKEMNLDIAGEYIVMASELMEMKSKILLPHTLEEEEELTNDLIERLTDYNNYKELIGKFKELEINRKDYFTKNPTIDLDITFTPKLTDDIELDDLIKAFNDYLKRKELEKPLNTKITSKEYSVSKRCEEIKKLLREKKSVKFFELFNQYNKSYIVVTFLSILNLVKEKEILINQNNNFEDFTVSEVLV